MALFQAVQVLAKNPTPAANSATEIIYSMGEITVTAAMATGDVIEMCVVPAGYVLTDYILDNDAAATTAFTANVGLLTGAYRALGARTCGSEFSTGKALVTAGLNRLDKSGGTRVVPVATPDRGVGLALTTVTTPTVGAKIRMTAFLRAQAEGV